MAIAPTARSVPGSSAPSCVAVPSAPLVVDRPHYVHVGNGKFEPANAAAWLEVERWNAYATLITARSAAIRSTD